MHIFSVFWYKFHAFQMIKYTDQATVSSRIFSTPFDNALDPSNRWVQMEKVIPWDKMAKVFMGRMHSNSGRDSIDLRIVMGAMFIQHSLNLTDRATLQNIQENIYLQYFVGLASFQVEPVFDHSLLSIFRKRLGKEGSSELLEIFLNHAIELDQIKHRKPRATKEAKQRDGNDEHNASDAQQEVEQQQQQDETVDLPDDSDQDGDASVKAVMEPSNRGTVKIDATVVPQSITYPTDTKLLNTAREISEAIIDCLYSHHSNLWSIKPRTYRREARKKWLGFSKSRRSSAKKIRAQKKADLSYLRRNLKHIDAMMTLLLSNDVKIQIDNTLRQKMYVISEIYRQQKLMLDNKSKQMSDRIVSISQPWVRPIVRGKAGSAVEFGAKVNLSLTEKYTMVDHSSFDAFHEGNGLISILESYKTRYGYYPEYALVDQIYLTRPNRSYMKKHNIKHTGKPLGRPKKDAPKPTARERKKNNERNHIEGKIGQAKLKYGMDRLRTKLQQTSYCAINLIALAMNMVTLQKGVFGHIYALLASSLAAVITPSFTLRLFASIFYCRKLQYSHT